MKRVYRILVAVLALSALMLACGGQAARDAANPPPSNTDQAPPGAAPSPGAEASPGAAPPPGADPSPGVQPPPGAPGRLRTILLSFKLDPRLGGGTYGGEVWVSPPTYTGAANQDVVDARARGADASGEAVVIAPGWIPSDPVMVTVSPVQGAQVTIFVKRAGQSTIDVTSDGLSRRLIVRATSDAAGQVVQVEISQ